MRLLPLFGCLLTTIASSSFCHFASAQDPIESWIAESAIPLGDNFDNLGRLDDTIQQMSVVGLGEATHGQHESFKLKRLLTMHLIRKHGYRLVAYEASVSRAIVANDYVAGKTDDLAKATRGLGMLIWHVTENSELLEDLRQWNRLAGPTDQVRLIGVDAQDTQAAKDRLCSMIPQANKSLADRAGAIVPRAQAAMGELMAGRAENWQAVSREIEQLGNDLRMITPDAIAKSDYEICVLEFLRSMTIYSTLGGRDEAMAELLLQHLQAEGAKAKCVVWAHNGHLQSSALRYLGSEQLAMGGHLAKALGDRYYAVGFAFGKGEFQANAKDGEGRWGFRRYRLSAPPNGSLEASLAAAKLDNYILDLRSAPSEPKVQKWLGAGHGQRWFGGYNVTDDCDQRTQDANQLLPTYPLEDFDGLVFMATTRAANPIDPSLIFASP